MFFKNRWKYYVCVINDCFIFKPVVKKKPAIFLHVSCLNNCNIQVSKAKHSAHVPSLWSIYFFSGEVHLVIHNLLLTRVWTEIQFYCHQTASFAYIVQESAIRLIVANAVSFNSNAKQYIKLWTTLEMYIYMESTSCSYDKMKIESLYNHIW